MDEKRQQLPNDDEEVGGTDISENNIWENDGVIAARKLLKKNDNLQT
jgi:hypothetical protein